MPVAGWGNTFASDDQLPRFYVQGVSTRGEPRVYWVVDRSGDKMISRVTRDRRQAWVDQQTKSE